MFECDKINRLRIAAGLPISPPIQAIENNQLSAKKATFKSFPLQD